MSNTGRNAKRPWSNRSQPTTRQSAARPFMEGSVLSHPRSRKGPSSNPHSVEQSYNRGDASHNQEMRKYWNTSVDDPSVELRQYSSGVATQQNYSRQRAASSKTGFSSYSKQSSYSSQYPVQNKENNQRTRSDTNVLSSQSDQTVQSVETQTTSLFTIRSAPNVHAMDIFKRLYWKIYTCCTPTNYYLQSKAGYEDLSKSIWQRNLLHQPHLKEFMAKMAIWKQLQILLDTRRRNNNFKLFVLGSTLTGLSVSGSDMDLCLNADERVGISKWNNSIFHLECLRRVLKTIKEIDNIKFIGAKVPLLKLTVLGDQRITVDITCNTVVSVSNSQLVYRYVTCDWRMQPLYSIIKQWAVYHGINNPLASTISTYSLVLLVINFLQCGISPPVLPCLHDILGNELKSWMNIVNSSPVEAFHRWNISWRSSNTMSLGELLIEFFRFYDDLDFTKYVISVRHGKIIKRSIHANDNNWANNDYLDPVIIEEPFIIVNTAYAIQQQLSYKAIKKQFSKAAEALKNTKTLESLFE